MYVCVYIYICIYIKIYTQTHTAIAQRREGGMDLFWKKELTQGSNANPEECLVFLRNISNVNLSIVLSLSHLCKLKSHGHNC